MMSEVKIRIAIVDDELRWRSKSHEVVRSYCYEYMREFEPLIEISEFASGEDFIDADEAFQIVFMDVEMTGMDGFDTAKAYGSRVTYLCFLTTHLELGRKGYLVNAFRYIDKGAMEDEIPEALSVVHEELLGEKMRRHMIELPVVGVGEVQIQENLIESAEVVNRHLILTVAGKKMNVKLSLRKLQKMLLCQDFVQVHKAIMVNLSYVEEICKDCVVMKSGERLGLAVRHYPDIKRAHMRFIMS